ncbi:hypothetical protein [Defluviimonas salinarum]|uniref:Uncharacterized protein n=1 Tax=Defluviimonas salinarum TaxID=2992147 RepID=A0ABT3J852_9RHOB|nr:hypothetical protein [Defluviimonas salinarum]MCW3783871.1 hypothetical protein [Defluviimonas salinarum]
MRGNVIKIERTSSRSGAVEEPAITAKGYQLADPAHGKHKHHADHATYVKTLDEAATLIERGFSLWMGAKGKRASLIAPKSLRIVRQDVALVD